MGNIMAVQLKIMLCSNLVLVPMVRLHGRVCKFLRSCHIQQETSSAEDEMNLEIDYSKI